MNLTMLLDMAADGFGDRIIVGRRKDGLSVQDLRKAALRGAAVLREAGADSLLYLAVNGPAFPVAMFAAAYAGVPLVPLNYRLGAEQLEGLIANHPQAVAIIDPTMTDPAAQGVSPELTTFTVPQWLELTINDSEVVEDAVWSEAPAVVIYTSGTTSKPKGVLLRHENLVSYVFGSVEFMASDPEHTALMSVPPYHIAAVANVITNLYAGRRFIVLERFEPEQWLDLVRTEGVTNALVVPTMLSRILESPADKELPTLKSLAYGGAPMPSAVIRRALDIWPDLDFVNAYGLTETSSTVAVLTPDDHRDAFRSDDPAVQARLSSVGKALPGIELEVRDLEDQVVPPGTKGRIFLRGDQVSAEYAGIGKMVDDRGFFDTRDEGHVDADGFLFIGGRTDDTIIRGAENIAPAEIEDVMLRHPAILDVAVVGLPDEEWGNRIVAAVVLREGQQASADEIKDFVRGTLRSSKTPDEIVFWDEMPRTETGKLVRRNVVSKFVDLPTG
ncbi:MAG: long-chain fatty acid--CoA ligase [Aeromicrobium sp.]|nr:long-chain fatty acid--CoA ligase [Aeromicrobium sp.]